MSRERRLRHLATANEKRRPAGLPASRKAGQGGGCHRARAAAAVVPGADRPLLNVSSQARDWGKVKVASGRRTEGVNTETGISHSVYKCQSIPVIRTFLSEVSFQTLIRIMQCRESGQL